MIRQFLRSFQSRLSGWRELILPGILIIGLVCLVRLSGLLQTQEWMALDTFSRYCAVQTRPQRIVIISIDEADYQATGGFPISDQVLAQTLTILKKYQPRVVGLNMFRDFSVGTGHEEMNEVMASMPNLVAIEVALNREPILNIAPPEVMSPDNVGFADLMIDNDGKLRRTILAARDWQGELKYALALQLARQYLAVENIPFQHGAASASPESIRSTDPIQFGAYTLPRFKASSGGYIRADAHGNQMLMNFCMLQKPFDTLALRDLLAENFESEQLADRIVIIGTIAASVKDTFITSAVRETLYSQRIRGQNSPPTQLIYGVEVQAHATQQIISSVLDQPCILSTWPDLAEYLWIVLWGMLGMLMSVLLQSPWKSVVSLAIATLLLVAISYEFLDNNWWIPVVPTGLALCGAGLVTAFFDRDIRFELAQRRIMVERTYEAVHNGPLQHLAAILRSLGEQDFSSAQLREQLQTLNTQLRSIFEHMRHDSAIRSDSLYLADNTVLDLKQPLMDLLYQVYEHTISQQLPGFATVQTYIPPDFDCLNQGRFSSEQKRGLCLFLQEALLNIGKHSIGATRIDVTCTLESQQYRLQILDNGQGFITAPVPIGEGTQQAVALAQRLKGLFRRRTHQNLDTNGQQGILCELIWPIS